VTDSLGVQVEVARGCRMRVVRVARVSGGQKLLTCVVFVKKIERSLKILKGTKVYEGTGVSKKYVKVSA
jgi:hypothetical protein